MVAAQFHKENQWGGLFSGLPEKVYFLRKGRYLPVAADDRNRLYAACVQAVSAGLAALWTVRRGGTFFVVPGGGAAVFRASG